MISFDLFLKYIGSMMLFQRELMYQKCVGQTLELEDDDHYHHKKYEMRHNLNRIMCNISI